MQSNDRSAFFEFTGYKDHSSAYVHAQIGFGPLVPGIL